MTDTFLKDLPQDGPRTAVIRGDSMLASRNNDSIRVRWTGDDVVPAYETADANKLLLVKKDTTMAYRSASSSWYVTQLSRRPHGSPYELNTKYTTSTAFTDCTMICLEVYIPHLPWRGNTILHSVDFTGIAGNRAVGNTYEFEIPPAGWAQLRITDNNTFMVDGRMIERTTTNAQVFAVWGIQFTNQLAV